MSALTRVSVGKTAVGAILLKNPHMPHVRIVSSEKSSGRFSAFTSVGSGGAQTRPSAGGKPRTVDSRSISRAAASRLSTLASSAPDTFAITQVA